MWKLTGIARSEHTCHTGSQWGIAMSGSPASSGLEQVTTPRRPLAWQRSISRTAASRSHHGSNAMPNTRWPLASWNSARASL